MVLLNLLFLRRSLCKQCISNLPTLKREPRTSHLTSLDSDVAFLICITNVTAKTNQIALFPGSIKKAKVCDEVRFDKLSLQQQCAYCGKTTLYFCEKCNVALHPECFIGFHEQ